MAFRSATTITTRTRPEERRRTTIDTGVSAVGSPFRTIATPVASRCRLPVQINLGWRLVGRERRHVEKKRGAGVGMCGYSTARHQGDKQAIREHVSIAELVDKRVCCGAGKGRKLLEVRLSITRHSRNAEVKTI